LPAGLQADLAITGRSVENHLAISLASGLAGLMLPLLLVAPFAAFFGLGMGLVPLWIALLLGALGAILPSLSVQSRPARRQQLLRSGRDEPQRRARSPRGPRGREFGVHL